MRNAPLLEFAHRDAKLRLPLWRRTQLVAEFSDRDSRTPGCVGFDYSSTAGSNVYRSTDGGFVRKSTWKRDAFILRDRSKHGVPRAGLSSICSNRLIS